MFKVGDFVFVDLIKEAGKIIAIENASPKLKEIIEATEEVILYRVDIGDGILITTTEDSLELLVVQQAPIDELQQKINS